MFIPIVLITFSLLFQVQCVCRESYATFCDNYNDINNYTNQHRKWTNLVIGQEGSSINHTVINLMKFPYKSMNKLESLTIINQISAIQVMFNFQCVFYNSRLKYLTLYENNLKKLTSFTFPLHNYKKISLKNNKIETLVDTVFFSHDIEVLDLSENLLEVIEKNTIFDIDNSREINLSHNRINHIEAGSFPASLEILNINNNQLRQLDRGVLISLTKLRELHAKNNKFKTIPSIEHLTEMRLLDMSNNIISELYGSIFEKMPKLTVLELSNNLVEESDLFDTMFVYPRNTSLSLNLAFNRFKYFDVSNASFTVRDILFLFGNPLDCSRWDKTQEKIRNNQDKCDIEFFASGKTPYCLNYSEMFVNFQPLSENNILQFLKVIKENEKLINCDLAVNFEYTLTSRCCCSKCVFCL